MGLNKIDIKILRFVCDRGAQLPDAEVARELRLKPSTVSYCLKKMRRDRVILRYNFRLNYLRLGFSTMAWVLFKFKPGVAAGAPGFAAKSLFESLLSYPQIHVVSFITGEHDLAIKVIEKDIAALNDFVMRLATNQKGALDEPKVLFCVAMYKTHNVALTDTTPYKGLCKTDFDILNCKMLHPDLGVREIAAGLSLHRNTVSKRWRMLWGQNVLMKKTPVVNPEYYDELGFGMKAIMLLDVDATMLSSVVKALVEMNEIHELNHILSWQNLMAIARVKNVAELFEFLKKIYAIKGVKQTTSYLVLYSQPHKPNYLIELSKAGMLPFKLSNCEACQQGKKNNQRQKR
ncbi:MAG: Lrp/AsnC family transcriptional regulator [Candidatus Diapherotrites archaeon]|nr:Lrp/AsnC family transcriptional regulator [Candidatus Diapherotrites archaeon]